jgi:uridylate kinase
MYEDDPTMAKTPKYQRILLKFSGEALAGKSHYGIEPAVLDQIAKDVKELIELGIQVGIVVGGGNLFRGETLSAAGIGRITGDHMGMLATLMNSLALRDAFERAGFETMVMSAIPMSGIVDHYDRRKAIYHLKDGKVVIFAAGTGNPLVTTDSAASLRAIETQADILLKATSVDGVYDSDPAKNPNAKRYDKLSFQEALQKELGVMDLVAFSQCRDHKMKIRVFNMLKPGALLRVVMGENEGTLVE